MTIHRATAGFWRRYNKLPKSVQQVADKNFELLKTDLRHPSLHFKQVGEAWSAWIGISHRALALKSEEGFDWFWIGTHAEYDRLVG